MKGIITYYGGKQKLAAMIVSLIPAHNLYCEAFLGGAAVFFQKEQSNVEVLNDTNKELMNFYRIVQTDFSSLEREIRITLHSRSAFRDAQTINKAPHLFSDVKRAWAIWTLAAEGFAGKLDSSWGYDIKKKTTSKKIANKRESFTEDYAIRLQEVQLECTDALRIINSRDTAESFFYLDPPYYNSDCGHYDGYTKEDFEMLMKQVSGLQGKFLMSSYPSDILTQYTKENGWYQISLKQKVSVANKSSKPQKVKTEVLTANYDIETLSKTSNWEVTTR